MSRMRAIFEDIKGWLLPVAIIALLSWLLFTSDGNEIIEWLIEQRL